MGDCSFCHEDESHPIHHDLWLIFHHEFNGSVTAQEVIWRMEDAERGVKP